MKRNGNSCEEPGAPEPLAAGRIPGAAEDGPRKAAWRCLERLEKPLCELEQLADQLGPDEELAWRLREIERFLEKAAAELREVVG